METLAAQTRYLLWFAQPMLTGLNDSHRMLEPVPGNKSAGWILGHLCITGDFGRRLCGRDPMVPKEWRSLFSPGTDGSGKAGGYPRMAELVDAFPKVYLDLSDAFASADADICDVPNPFEPAREHFPTVGHFVPWLLTGHLGYHIGQLGDWRRAAGLGHKAQI